MNFRRDKNDILCMSRQKSAKTAGATKTKFALLSHLTSGATSAATKTSFPLFAAAKIRRDKNIYINIYLSAVAAASHPSRGGGTRAALLCGARVLTHNTVTKKILSRLMEVPA